MTIDLGKRRTELLRLRDLGLQDLQAAGELLQAAGNFLRQRLTLDHAGTCDQEERPVDASLEMGELHGGTSECELRRIHARSRRSQHPYLSRKTRPEATTRAAIYFFFDWFKSTAARTRAFSAFSSTFSPSRMSMARRALPSRLELNSLVGSGSDAPLAKVSFTTLL